MLISFPKFYVECVLLETMLLETVKVLNYFLYLTRKLCPVYIGTKWRSMNLYWF